MTTNVAHNLLGYVRYVEHRPAESADHFAAAIAARPTMHEAHNNLGLALAAQGGFAEAIPHYRGALRPRPGFATAGFKLAIALGRPGANEAAAPPPTHLGSARQLDRQELAVLCMDFS